MTGTIMRLSLGLLDTLAALTLFIDTLRITTDWGVWTRQERWSLMRRVVNYGATLALLYIGIGRLDHRYPEPDLAQFCAGVMITIYVIFYPRMRAMGWISQDELLPPRARKPPESPAGGKQPYTTPG